MSDGIANLAAHHVAEFRRFDREMPCLFEDLSQCSQRPINSHTISKSQLRLIADRGKLLTIIQDLHADNPVEATRVGEIGYKNASTFPGFCAHHDNELFKNVDGPSIELSTLNVSRMFLRSLGHEFRKKLKMYGVMGSFQLEPVDRYKQQFIALKRHGFEIGARNLYYQFLEISKRSVEEIESAYQYFAVRITPRLPYGFAAPIVPESTPKYGIWNRNLETSVLPACLLAAIPQVDSTLAIICWHRSAARVARPVLNRFAGGTKKLAETLFQLGLEEIENFYINPSWYAAKFPSDDRVGEFFRANVDGQHTPYDHQPFSGLFTSDNFRIAGKATNADWVRLWHRRHM